MSTRHWVYANTCCMSILQRFVYDDYFIHVLGVQLLSNKVGAIEDLFVYFIKNI